MQLLNPIKPSIFLLVILSCIKLCLTQLTAKIQQSSQTSSSSSNHILTVLFSNTQVPIGSFINLQYTSAWTISSMTGYNSTSDFCETGCTISGVNITVNSVARTVQVRNLFPRLISAGENRIIRYTLKGLVNPSYKLTDNVIITLLDNTASLIDLTTTQVTVLPRQIACSVSRASTLVSATTQYRITVNPSPITIPSNLYIMMLFPTIWSNSAQSGTYSSSLSVCSSTINPSIFCNTAGGNFNVTNILTTSTSASFSYNITNIKNPGSQENNNQLILEFYSAGNQLAYCYVPITGTTAKTIPDLSISMSGNMGAIIIALVNFTITQQAKTTDIVQIQLPKQYNCSILYTSFVYLNAQTVNRQATLNVNSTSTMTYITFQPFFTVSTALYRIQLYNIQLPKTTSTISQIKLSITRNGALVASQSCCSFSYPLTTGGTSLAVTLSNYAVGSVSTHYIALTSDSSLKFYNDYTYMLIQFDSKYTLSSSSYTCYMIDALTIIQPLICTRNTTTSILVSNFNKSEKISNTLFTIGIDSVLTPVTISSVSLNLYTLDSAYNLIENISTTYLLTTTKINNVSVTPGIYTTYASTFYTFKIKNTNTLSTNAVIIIVFPSQIRISSTSQCYINNTATSASNCIIDQSNSTNHKITLSLSNTVQIASSSLSSTNITITLVTNPLSLEQSSSFYLQLIANTGEVIEALSQGITVTMTAVLNTFSYFGITVTDTTTMAVANYTVTYQLPIDISSVYGSTYISPSPKLILVLPSQYQCVSTIYTSKPCLVASTQSQILSSTLSTTPSTTNLSFVIPSVTNPSTVTVSSTITARLMLAGYLSIEYVYSGLNSFVAAIIGYGLVQDNYWIGEKARVGINISYIANWRSSALSRYLVIVPPTDYTVDASLNITCNQPNATITTTISSGTLQQIKLDNVYLLVNLSISISNIINPSLPSSLPTSTKWRIQYRETSSNSIIAISNSSLDVAFNVVCTLPCRSCLAGNVSYCKSCYTAIPSILFKYLDTTSNTCVVSCSTTQFLSTVTADLSCYPCASSCLTCLNSSDNCTSCSASSSTFLYLNTQKCVTNCPPEYYPKSSNRQCTLCTSPCLYCTGSSGLTCTLCVSSYVLTVYVNGTTTCSLSCPSSYYNYSNQCYQCSSNCSSCVQSNQCTVCQASYYLYNGSCIQNCPYSFYISISSGNKNCVSCQSPCLTCLTYSTYCTTCNISNSSTNKYLFVNSTLNTSTCLTACPSKYYPNQALVCQACISPCLLCTSPIDCSSCVTGYYLYPAVSLCYSTCPENTILVTASQNCQECSQPCLECVGSITNCISCIQGYFLDTTLNLCNLTCTLPYFAINRKCVRCASPCVTCTPLQPYSCTSCISGYLLYGTTCYQSTCPDGSYKTSNNITCATCTSGCLTCINSSSTCLSCYPGLYLYQQSCLPSCPTSPILYYQYQMQCIACQPQCVSCISSPIQCTSCANTSLYFNQITRQCTTSCTPPYYESTTTTKLCVQCKLPCKTCSTSELTCASCYNGRYLYNSQCLQDCSTSTYANTQLNVCSSCSLNCQECTSANSCTKCIANSYYLRGYCYLVCPADAPFTYQNKYCRNCILDNCLLCDESKTQPTCLLCEPLYYLYDEKCTSACPIGYQPDSITKSLCIQTQQSALLALLKKLQKFKIYLLPGSILFVGLVAFVIGYMAKMDQFRCCQSSTAKLYLVKNNLIWVNILHFLIGIPQTISYICYLAYLILYPTTYYHPELVNIAYYIIFGIFVIINIAHFIVNLQLLKSDKIFLQWANEGIDKDDSVCCFVGKNYRRFVIVMGFSMVINRKIFFLLFSGCWRIPITCCQVSSKLTETLLKRNKIICLIVMLLVQIPIAGYTIYTLIIQKYYLSNYKLFFGTIDIAVISLLAIAIQIAFLTKSQFSLPNVYKKYILQKVSNRTLPAFSERQPQQIQEDDDDELNLHRSNSAQGLKKQSEQMKAIDYISVFDTDQYQDPQLLAPNKIEKAIDHGKFRKKNLKKKKKKFNWELDVIQQEDSQQQENVMKKQKKKPKFKKQKLGFMNNYMYWKPPQQQKLEKLQKNKPQREFKLHEKQIMQTIRQKQSDFDTITRNDIIFQQEPFQGNSSHDSDPEFYIEDSRRAFNFQYQAFINKNYAKKRHM